MAATATLTDTFDTLDTAKWTNRSGTYAATGGVLIITGATASAYVESAGTYSMFGSYACLKVTGRLTTGNSYLRIWYVSGNFTDYLQVGILAAGTFEMRQAGAGATTSTVSGLSVPFWVGIREASGTLYFYSAATEPTGAPIGTSVDSTDANGWTLRYAPTRGFAGSDGTASVRIMAGATSTGTFEADNVNVFAAAAAAELPSLVTGPPIPT